MVAGGAEAALSLLGALMAPRVPRFVALRRAWLGALCFARAVLGAIAFTTTLAV